MIQPPKGQTVTVQLPPNTAEGQRIRVRVPDKHDDTSHPQLALTASAVDKTAQSACWAWCPSCVCGESSGIIGFLLAARGSCSARGCWRSYAKPRCNAAFMLLLTVPLWWVPLAHRLCADRPYAYRDREWNDVGWFDHYHWVPSDDSELACAAVLWGLGWIALGLALCCCGAWTTPRDERCVCYPVKYRPCSRRCAAGSGLGLLAAAVLFVVLLYFSTGCGSNPCWDNGRCVGNGLGLLAPPECACEGNFIGQFCQTECRTDCGVHGNLTGNVEAAREANSCSALSCTCSGDAYGEFCEYHPLSNATVPAQCAAGMGSHGVVYNGTAYRTLDDAPPEGGRDGAPNRGCQRNRGSCVEHGSSGRCRTYEYGPNYLPLPPGYALAPPDADTIAVIAAHGWSTSCAVTAGGTAWRSANFGNAGDRYGLANYLASSGGSHTVTTCNRRVLARCP
eukprot:COSAG04_NODE_1290_length_7359_cov_33.592837_3_plen_450_part_00